MRSLLISILTLVSLASCTSHRNDASCYTDLAKEGWSYRDTIVFSPSVADSVVGGTLSLAIRHDGDYPYSELWMEVITPTGRRDTIGMRLADEQGRWIGKGFGDSYQIEVNVPRHVTLHSGFPVKVRHIMRVDTVKGVNQLGVIFLADN